MCREKKASGVPLPNPELLAPAGSPACALAAFEAGADAIYAGLAKFNARERGENFTPERMAQIIEYAHKLGRKVYVTLNTLVKYYGCNEKHVEQTVRLSIQLFKQLRVLHKFPRVYLKVLKIAASLHDSGRDVRYYNYEQHSRYVILNSGIYGATHREIVLAAFVAGCSRKGDIGAAEWAKYKDIVTEEDQDVVRKLGVLLRIGEALDRSGLGVVTGINCDVLGDSVIMKTEVEGDATLEIRDAMAANGEFRKSFRKNLEIL